MQRTRRTARKEAFVWEIINGDLIRKIAYFLPASLTPSDVWHLASVCRSSRDELAEWLNECRSDVERARQLYKKAGGSPKSFLASAGMLMWDRKELDSDDICALGRICNKNALKLRILSLALNRIGDAGCAALAEIGNTGCMHCPG